MTHALRTLIVLIVVTAVALFIAAKIYDHRAHTCPAHPDDTLSTTQVVACIN